MKTEDRTKQQNRSEIKQYYSITVLQNLATQIYEQGKAKKIIQNATEQKKV